MHRHEVHFALRCVHRASETTGIPTLKSLRVQVIRQSAAFYNQELTSAMSLIKSFYGALKAGVNRIGHGRHSEKIHFRERLRSDAYV